MKSRLFSVVVSILLCAVLAKQVKSSPIETNKKEVESFNAKAFPAETDTNDDDDSVEDLSRPKKSSTTTFCVEIKPGNDQPAVVICDPSKNDQVHIPTVPTPRPAHPPAPTPTPPPSHTSYNPHQIPVLIPEPQPQFEALPYEPMIIVPQPPLIPPYFQQPPQILLVRDPSCASNNPGIMANPLQYGYAPARLYSPQQFARDAGIYDGAADEAMQRSIPGLSANGLSTSGFTSPLDLLYSKRGPSSQQLQSLGSNGATNLLNGNQNYGIQQQQQRPYVIQCNPTLTPLPQQSLYRDNNGDKQGSPMLREPGGYGSSAGYQMNHGGISTHNNHHSNQHGSRYPPSNQHHNMHNQGYGQHYRKSAAAAEGIRGAGGFDSQVSQTGVPSGVNAGSTINLQDQEKSVLQKSAEGDKFKGYLLNEANSYGNEKQRSSINSKSNKDQGIPPQPPQYRQKAAFTPGIEQKQFSPAQQINTDMPYAQRTMNRLKSAVA